MADTFKTDRINTTTSKNKKIGFGFSDPSGSYPTSEYFYKSSILLIARIPRIKTPIHIIGKASAINV